RKPGTREEAGAALDEIESFLKRQVRRLILVEDEDRQRESIIELIGHEDVEISAFGTGEEAFRALESETFDCMVLDLNLPDMSGFELIERLKNHSRFSRLPVVVYTGKELSREEEAQLARLAETVIVKDAQSPERLLDETALFLHRVESNLPEAARQILRRSSTQDSELAGKRVLIVDDDLRNIFATTALLEQYSMVVQYAEDGNQALERLKQEPQTD